MRHLRAGRSAAGRHSTKRKVERRLETSPWTAGDALGFSGTGGGDPITDEEDKLFDISNLRAAVTSVHTAAAIDSTVQVARDDFNAITAAYNPELYAFTMFSALDIVMMLHKSDVLRGRGQWKHLARWFGSPHALLAYPQSIVSQFGLERWRQTKPLLLNMLDGFHGTPPSLAHPLRQHQLDEGVWVPFLRGLSGFAVHNPILVMRIPKLVECLIKGDILEARLTGEPRDRAFMLASLFLASGVEFGRMEFVHLALEMMTQFGFQTTAQTQRRVMLAVHRTSARRCDWQVRQSGHIEKVAPYWTGVYRCQVQSELDRLQKLTGDADAHDTLVDTDVDPEDTSLLDGMPVQSPIEGVPSHLFDASATANNAPEAEDGEEEEEEGAFDDEDGPRPTVLPRRYTHYVPGEAGTLRDAVFQDEVAIPSTSDIVAPRVVETGADVMRARTRSKAKQLRTTKGRPPLV